MGEPFSSDQPEVFVEECARFLSSYYPSLRIIVSAGKNGAYAVTHERWNYCPAPAVEVASTAGAGDCLLGGILAAIARGIPLLDSSPPRRTLAERPVATALDSGVLLASYKVTSPHTIHPDASWPALLRFAQEKGIGLAPSLEAMSSCL
jgi:sugar/nucleoside kinase (ribokinase family)